MSYEIIDDGALDALRELAARYRGAPEEIAEIISVFDPGSQLFDCQVDRSAAVPADKFVVVYKPSDGLLRALAALRARYSGPVNLPELPSGHDPSQSSRYSPKPVQSST